MSSITFGDGAEDAFVTVASNIQAGYVVALLDEGEEPPAGSECVQGTDVSFLSCDDQGVTYAGLDFDGCEDGTTGLRPWTEIARIHVY